MAYEAEMAEIARGSRSRWGPLREVIFLEANNNSLLVFAQGPIPARELTGMLTFGYSGTGPQCYATFLAELGFRTNVEEVRTPAKLTKDGRWTHGKRKSAQWSVEVEGQTVDEAKSKLKPIDQRAACVIREEILSDGSQKDLTEAVQAGSDADALDMVQRGLPAGSTVVSSDVRETMAESEEEILADTHPDASALAQAKIESWEAPYKTVVGVRCETEPRKGLLGIGKRSGRFLAKYRTNSREVHLAYRPLARIRVLYGPKKLTCNQCGQVMATITEGVHYASGSLSSEAAILKLRCDACDITRFEKRWEIEGYWIEWEDNSPLTIA